MSAPIETRVAELEAQVKELISKYEEMLNNKRDRGPASEREMTEEDAFKIKFGELKSMKQRKSSVSPTDRSTAHEEVTPSSR
jgi:hypothetical protein